MCIHFITMQYLSDNDPERVLIKLVDRWRDREKD